MSEPSPPPAPTRAGWHWGAAAAATVCIFVWGAVPLVTKVAARDLDGLLIGVLRTALGLPLVTALLLAGRYAVPRGVDVWRALALVGATSCIGFPVLFSIGQSLTTASHGGLIIATAPIVTGIISALWHRQWPGAAWMVGGVLGFAGVVALILLRGGITSTGAGPTLTGDLVVLVSVLAVALGYVAGTRLARTMGSGPVTYWSNVAAAVLLLPWLLWDGRVFHLGGVGADSWLAVAYLAVFAQVANYVLWYWAMDRGGIASIAAFQFVQPVITLVLAVAFLGEMLSPRLLICAAVILAGVGLCQFRTLGRLRRTASPRR